MFLESISFLLCLPQYQFLNREEKIVALERLRANNQVCFQHSPFDFFWLLMWVVRERKRKCGNGIKYGNCALTRRLTFGLHSCFSVLCLVAESEHLARSSSVCASIDTPPYLNYTEHIHSGGFGFDQFDILLVNLPFFLFQVKNFSLSSLSVVLMKNLSFR